MFRALWPSLAARQYALLETKQKMPEKTYLPAALARFAAVRLRPASYLWALRQLGAQLLITLS
ncbi:hypothetical protein HNQ93_004007 [Hymenobacter luteus]|uniref:Uncharacterized protein n=2 Tax=Hymenobacter TaxID=89966 RepID=A0A7W9T647_9BACT|nr:hypothetical protein [Hymenobacter latericoloratus]MBB6061129.1 hypothetical protein [Hymenobacter luteus]